MTDREAAMRLREKNEGGTHVKEILFKGKHIVLDPPVYVPRDVDLNRVAVLAEDDGIIRLSDCNAFVTTGRDWKYGDPGKATK